MLRRAIRLNTKLAVALHFGVYNFVRKHDALRTDHNDRQELKRFERKRLGYSKSLEMHKLAVALHFGVYNFVRKHHSLGTTPAVAAGLEEKPWILEKVVEMTSEYQSQKPVSNVQH
jgi:hypothetical protein